MKPYSQSCASAPAPSAADQAQPAVHRPDGEPALNPEHFKLSPEVARMPLARRRRRLGAILVDLALVAGFTHIFSSLALLAGTALAGLVYWAAGRSFAPNWMQRPTTRIILALALGGLPIAAVPPVSLGPPDHDGNELAAASEVVVEQKSLQVPLEELGLGPRELFTLATTEDSNAARALASKIGRNLESQPDRQEIAQNILKLLDDEVPISAAVRSELRRVLEPVASQPEAAQPPDPLGPEGAELRRANAALAAKASRLSKRLDSMAERLDEARKDRGVLHFLKASAHDLGFGIGWSYLYFIGFLALWKGRTPGKRLFGIRVVRIDGKPMTLWRSWERFHGYAASLLTGLIGFLQVLWDPSRQCLHDKVAETVVVGDPPSH